MKLAKHLQLIRAAAYNRVACHTDARRASLLLCAANALQDPRLYDDFTHSSLDPDHSYHSLSSE